MPKDHLGIHGWQPRHQLGLMMSRVRIAFHMETGSEIGGSDIYIGHIVNALDPEAWDVYLITRADFPLERVGIDRSRVRLLGGAAAIATTHRGGSDLVKQTGQVGKIWSSLPKPVRQLGGFVKDAHRIRKLLSRESIELFHTTDIGAPAIGAALAGCGVIASFLTEPPTRGRIYHRLLSKIVYSASHACIVKSLYAKKLWRTYLALSGHKIRCIPNGVDLSRFTVGSAPGLRQQLRIPEDAVVVGMTGRLAPEKGAFVLARAMLDLMRSRPQLYFVLTGEGPESSAITELFHSNGLADRLRMLGFRSDSNVITKSYDIAVVPSIWQELFGWVIIEAMACGRPVVATSVGGIPEIITHNVNGILVRPNRADDLVDAIDLLIRNPKFASQLAMRGHESVVNNYSTSIMMRNTIDLYMEVYNSVKYSQIKTLPAVVTRPNDTCASA